MKTYESAGERVRRFERTAAAGMRRERQERAQAWREARRVLFALPQAERERALVRWNALHYPGEPGTFQRFLEKREWANAQARWDLSWPEKLWIRGCTPERNPAEQRMPASRRFLGPEAELSGHAQGAAILVLSAERGLIRSYDRADAADRRMDEPRAAEMASDPAALQAAERTLYHHARDERPPFGEVMITGSPLHQQVLRRWEEAGLFRRAPVLYVEASEDQKAGAVAEWLGLFAEAATGVARAPAQGSLLDLL